MSQATETNLVKVMEQYLKTLRVPFTAEILRQQLEENPYYPSLYAISTVLKRYHVENEAFEVEQADIGALEPPFLAFYNVPNRGKDFVLVTDITATHVSYDSGDDKITVADKAAFANDWEKVVLASDASAKSIEPNYDKNRRIANKLRSQRAALASGAIVIFLLLLFNSFWDAGVYPTLIAGGLILLTKLCGLSIAMLLVVYDIDKANAFVKHLCSANGKTGCGAVLTSNAATFLGIKWSEAGFFYFGSSSLFLLYPGIPLVSKVPIIALAATVVSPYIIFSIYYQARVAKQWCRLCLATQAVLLLELGWSIGFYWRKPVSDIISTPIVVAMVISILVPITAWYLLKNTFRKAKESKEYVSAYRRLIYHPDYLNLQLDQQDSAAAGWEELGINLGKAGAKNTIIKVCNPYCGPCARAHLILDDILEIDKDVQVKVIFNSSNDDADKGSKPVRHLLAIAAKNDTTLTGQALDDWYAEGKKDYEAFAERHPLNGELKQQAEKILAMKAWCKETGITHTPTFFINGKRLPPRYSVEELKYLFNN